MSNELGTAIRIAREGRGWSQETLAQRVGTTQSTIDRIENGTTRRSRVLPEVAAVLGIPLQAPSAHPQQKMTAEPVGRPYTQVTYKLPIDLIDRIKYFKETFDGASDDWAVTHLLEHALNIRDDIIRITDRIIQRYTLSGNLRDAAGHVLSYHPMIKSIQFEDSKLRFELLDGSSSEINSEGIAILREPNGDYLYLRQSSAYNWLSRLNFIKPDYPNGIFNE